MLRRLAAVLAALSLTLALSSVALATTEPLHQGTNIAWNDPSIEVDCDGASVPSGMVLWHFVAHTTTDDFLLTADFTDDAFDVAPPDPESEPDMIVDSFELHWNVITSLTTLESASITGTGTVNEGGFNLSHVCPNPGEIIPESPASALLVMSAAVLGFVLIGWRTRRSWTAA